MYALHVLAKDYARSRLDSASEAAAAQKHAAYYLHLAQTASHDWEHIEKALPQIRLIRSRVPRDDVDGLWSWAAALHEFFHLRGYWHLSMEWLEMTLAAAQAKGDRSREAGASPAAGWQLKFGNASRALDLYQASLVAHQELGDTTQEAAIRSRLAYLRYQAGDLEAARAEAQLAEEIYTRTGNAAGIVESRHIQGLVYQQLGRFAEALAQYQSSREAALQAGNERLSTMTTQNIGVLYEQ